MSDSTSPVASGSSPEQDVVTPKLPRASEDDLEIDKLLFSVTEAYTTVWKDPPESYPAYLVKSYYDPGMGGEFNLQQVVHLKVERKLGRSYPNISRSSVGIYCSGYAAFIMWWGHLVDDAYEIDKEAVQQTYITQFMQEYYEQVSALDYDHPEELEAYHQRKDREAEHIRNHGPQPRYEASNYYVTSERWKPNVAADGRAAGSQAVQDDIEIGMGFHDGKVLDDMADERFCKWWKEMTWCTYFEDLGGFDYVALRTIYFHNFKDTYAQQSRSGSISPGTQTTGARILRTQRDQNRLVYSIEITDPPNLTAPLPFEVAIRTEHGITTVGGANDAG